jgi:hypothetical protein
MINSIEKALQETWKMKEKFYEDNKNLSTIEILKKLDIKYKDMEYGAQHITNDSCYAAYSAARGSVG